MQQISPFVDFNFKGKMSRQKKALVSKYFNALYGHRKNDGFAVGLLSQPHLKLKRPRNKKREKMARQFAQAHGLTRLKVIPIPSPDTNAKIVFDKKSSKIKLIYKDLEKIVEFFNQKELILNTAKEVNRILNKHKKIMDWQIMAGHSETPVNSTVRKESLLPEIERLMNKYANFGEWLFGLKGFKFKNQKTLEQFLVQHSKKKRKIKGDLRRIRRKGRL